MASTAERFVSQQQSRALNAAIAGGGTAAVGISKGLVTALRAGAIEAGGYGALTETLLATPVADLGLLVALPVPIAAAIGWGIGKLVNVLLENHDPDTQRFLLADAAIKSRERAADSLGRPLTREELQIMAAQYKKARAALELHLKTGL